MLAQDNHTYRLRAVYVVGSSNDARMPSRVERTNIENLEQMSMRTLATQNNSCILCAICTRAGAVLYGRRQVGGRGRLRVDGIDGVSAPA